jgi:hypothetical protein
MKMKLLLLSGLFCVSLVSRGADITGYSTTVNNRFSSGFPLTPVENDSGSFVGAGYDWSPIAWSTSTYASSSYKGFALLSPKHFLAAQHYEYTTELTSGVRVLDGTGTVQTRSVSSMTNTGYGLVLTNRGFTNPDIAVGTLGSAFDVQGKVSRLGVLDLHTSSSSDSSYTSQPVLLTGRTNSTPNGSPVVGAAVIDLTAFNGGDPLQPYLRTTHASVQLEVGDSGHPTLRAWTNPNGEQELTVLGVNSLSDAINGFNYISMLAQKDAMAATSAIMATDGYALRIVGPVQGTWVGGAGGPNSDNISNGTNWSGSFSDQHVLFDAASTAVEAIEVNAATNLRGLYFKSTAAGGDGFSFGGASTLTLGRGGLTNYDGDRQIFTANLALAASQYWDVGSGGVTAGNIQTNGFLLEVGGEGHAILNGTVSGVGGLALSGAQMSVSGNATYTGGTWVHDGVMNVSGDISTSSGVEIAAYGTLAGTGVVSGLSGAGAVAPGNSPGILTTSSVDPSGGLDFHFEFTATGSPDYTDASASIQDVLRITGGTPFSSAMTGSNTINLYLNVGSLNEGDSFRGAFYTDTAGDFLTDISGASYQWYLADAGGGVNYNGVDYAIYSGPLSFSVSTVAESADFGAGIVNGQVMQFVVVPELSSLTLALLVVLGCFLLGKRREVDEKRFPLPRGGKAM